MKKPHLMTVAATTENSPRFRELKLWDFRETRLLCPVFWFGWMRISFLVGYFERKKKKMIVLSSF